MNEKKQETQRLLKQSGFSIVELLIYMGLFSGFLVILSALFISTLEAQSDASATSHTDQDSWYVYSRLQHDLYQASSITTPANNGDETNSLVLEVDGSTITYSLVNNQLAITKDAQTDPIVSGEVSVSNLNFKRLGNESGTSSILVNMQLQNSVSVQVKDVNITVGLRQ